MFMASCFGWSLHQMDVKIAFFNGVIEEEVYINNPRGLNIHGWKTHVCRLKKALYALKQATQAWSARIDEYLPKFGCFNQSALYHLEILSICIGSVCRLHLRVTLTNRGVRRNWPMGFI